MSESNIGVPEYKPKSLSDNSLADKWNSLPPRTKGIILAVGGGAILGVVVLITRNRSSAPSKDLTGYDIVDDKDKNAETSPFDDSGIIDAINNLSDKIDGINNSGNSGNSGYNTAPNYGSDYGIGSGNTLSYSSGGTSLMTAAIQPTTNSFDYVSPSARLDSYDTMPAAKSIVTDSTGRMTTTVDTSLKGPETIAAQTAMMKDASGRNQSNVGRPETTENISTVKSGSSISIRNVSTESPKPKVRVNAGRTSVEQN